MRGTLLVNVKDQYYLSYHTNGEKECFKEIFASELSGQNKLKQTNGVNLTWIIKQSQIYFERLG